MKPISLISPFHSVLSAETPASSVLATNAIGTGVAPPRVIALSQTNLHAAEKKAVLACYDAREPRFRGLPPPVRLRASGAVQAWHDMAEQLPWAKATRHALADPALSLPTARDVMKAQMSASMGSQDPFLMDLLAGAGNALAHFWRGGAFYEPSPALTALLNNTDWSADLPMRCIQPPRPAMCILPAQDQRYLFGSVSAIQVFAHPAEAVDAPAHRCVTLVAHEEQPGEGPSQTMSIMMMLRIGNEEELLSDLIERTILELVSDRVAASQCTPEAVDSLRSAYRMVLDCVVKLLLYLNLDDAVLTEQRDHSEAPRQFAGLGKRKREARMAEVERLYDRYIVGPVRLAECTGAQALATHAQLSPHWRRGHFRLQAHGPRASLRKLMFIMPTLIRADRLHDPKVTAGGTQA